MTFSEKYEKKVEAADLPVKTKDQIGSSLKIKRSPIPSSSRSLNA